jgi:hypothetical protein
MITKLATIVAIAVLATAGACDGKATASDPPNAAGPVEKVAEYESCSTSRDCATGLRCFDETCRRSARSNVGDYYAAVGARQLADSKVDAAVGSYAQAVARYEADKQGIPPEVDCGYGAALVAARSDHDKAELGARVLHRCLMGAPAGSTLRDRALATLAILDDSGLEPAHLAADKPADVYLSRAPAAPAADKLKITAAGDPPPPGSSFALITDRVTAADLHGALVACWQPWFDATKKQALVVGLPIKVRYQPSQYDDEPGTFTLALDPAPGGSAPEATATACVRGVVDPALATVRGFKDGFQTKLTIRIE